MCPNCQAPVRADSDFCTSCGTRLRAEPPGSAAATQPAPGQAGPGQPPWGHPQAPGQPAPGQPSAGQPPYAQPAPWANQTAPRPSVPAFKFDVKRLGPADLAIGGASAVVFISLFLPWFGILGYTTSGLSLHGYLAIALLASLALIGYLALRAGWENAPVKLPIAHAPLLLIGTGVQLLLVLVGFLQSDGLTHEFGAYLGLLAALAACGAIVAPMTSSARSTPPGGQR